MKNSLHSGPADVATDVRVAIVDDDPLYTLAVRNNFSKKPGYRFYSFESGEDLVKNLHHFDPHIVVLDYQLNDSGEGQVMDGIQTLQELKKMKPETEVFMISGHGNTEVAADSVRFGAAEYIVKDYQAMRILRDRVDRVADKVRDHHLKIRDRYRTLFLAGVVVILIAVSFFSDRFLDGHSGLAALLLFAVTAAFGFVYWRTVKKKQARPDRSTDKKVEQLVEHP